MRIHLLPIALLTCCVCVAGAQNTTPDDVLTQRLHQNSSLYTNRDKGESLRAKAARKSGDVSIQINQMENYYVDPDQPTIDTANNPYIKNATLHSDIVAIGRVVQTMSELTPNESFIFSDAQFVLDSVLFQASRNSKMYGNMTGNEVTVTYPGGQVEVDGHKVDDRLSNEPILETGHTYMLFLHYLPALSTYDITGFRGFDLTGTTVKALAGNPQAEISPIMANREAFIAATRKSVEHAKSEARK